MIENVAEASRDLHRTLLKAQSEMGEGFFVHEDGRLVYANEACSKITGYGPEELMALPSIFGLVVAEEREDLLERMSRRLVGEPVVEHYESAIVRKDGRRADVEVTVKPFREGERTRLVVLMRDITERKQAEQALRESERRFSTLLANAPVYFYRCRNEPDWPNEFVSDYAPELTGYMPEDLSDGSVMFGDLIVEDDHQRVWEETQRALAERRRFRLRYAIRRRDGELRHVEDNGQGVYDVEGNLEALEGIVYDVTERERAEAALREAEARYRMLVEQVPAVIYIDGADETNSVIYRSPQIEAVLGYTPEDLGSGSLCWQDLLHPDDRERVLEENERTNTTGEPFSTEYRMIATDGRVVWIRDEATLVRDDAGEPLYWQGVFTDITERKEAEARREEAEARYRTLVEQIPAVTYIQQIEYNYTAAYISPQIEAMTGYSPEDFYTNPELWYGIVHPDDYQRLLDEDRRTDRTSEPFRMEYRMVRRDGRAMWVRDEAILVEDAAGHPRFWQGVIFDITERKVLEERLEHQALHDPLTDLPNRALFMDRLSQALARSGRRNRKVAVLFLDLDDFKVINDSLGHDAGDELLVAVASRLREGVRSGDTVARFGGDEFALLLEEVEAAREAAQTAKRIAEVLRAPFAVDGNELFVAPSIGIALNYPGADRPEDLLRNADLAMYEAKAGGKARHAVFEPGMDARAAERLTLGGDLRRALKREEFRVFYQPKLSLKTGGIVGFEALLRWEHPQRGLVSPAKFIPLAEETGLIVPMGRWVLAEACRQAKEWHERHPVDPPPMMSVNLSPRQFRDPGLAGEVARALQESGLRADSLVLEITESILVEDAEFADDALRGLKDIGVKLAIDDFGKGYSSLSYLKRLPADFLKIDRSLVENLERDRGNLTIVQTVVTLARAFRLEVVAEGVETAEEASELRALGCDLAQGYHFWRPVPGEAAGALLAATAG